MVDARWETAYASMTKCAGSTGAYNCAEAGLTKLQRYQRVGVENLMHSQKTENLLAVVSSIITALFSGTCCHKQFGSFKTMKVT